jgi:hypothetical protein
MCSPCYQRWARGNPERRKVAKPTCHPEKPYKARGMCSGCYQVWWAEHNPEAYYNKHRYANLRRFYGVDKADYERILVEQGGVCAICAKAPDETKRGKVLCVDHDHVLGSNRALLCHSCNRALGLLGDDPTRLREAADYLDRWSKNG